MQWIYAARPALSVSNNTFLCNGRTRCGLICIFNNAVQPNAVGRSYLSETIPSCSRRRLSVNRFSGLDSPYNAFVWLIDPILAQNAGFVNRVRRIFTMLSCFWVHFGWLYEIRRREVAEIVAIATRIKPPQAAKNVAAATGDTAAGGKARKACCPDRGKLSNRKVSKFFALLFVLYKK